MRQQLDGHRQGGCFAETDPVKRMDYEALETIKNRNGLGKDISRE